VRDPFEFDDYFISDYVATIEKLEFVVSEEYNNLQAQVTNKYDEPQVGNDGETRTDRMEFYSVGDAKFWVPAENGTAFVSADGDPDKRIRSNSAFGKLVIAVVDVVGRDDFLRRTPADLDPRLNPLYVAAPYVGLRLHWVTTGAGVPWENKKTGQSGVSRGSQLPVGFADEGANVQAERPPFDVGHLGLDDQTLADLTTFAKGYGVGEFQSHGISLLRDLHDDEAYGKLSAALSEISFYETLRAS
jgi:hypothetical protein